jgi:translocation and assembly module TamB
MSVRRLLAVLPLFVLLLISSAWYWLLHTEAGARWVWTRVENATAGALSAREITGSIRTVLTAREIHFSGDGMDVRINRVSLAVDIDFLPLRVTVLPAEVSDLVIDLSGEGQSDKDSNLQETFAKLQLPVELVFTEVNLERGAIVGIGDGAEILVDTLSLAGTWHNSWIVERFSVKSQAGTASGNGSFALHGDNELYLDVDASLASDLTGLDDNLSFEATIQGPLEDLTGQGRIDDPRTFWYGRVTGLTSDLRWELRLEMPGFELPADTAEFSVPPADLTANVRGGDASITVDAEVGFVDTDMQVRLAAKVDVDTETVSSKVEWDRAHWPVGHPQPQVSSQTGALTVSGSIDDWTVAGTIDLAVPELPQGTLTIDGGGNRDGAEVQILEGKVLGGTVAGRVQYSWSTPNAYAADLTVNQVRTATAFPKWPAILSGNVKISGQPEPFQMTATLSGVNGEFYAQQLEAEGNIDIRDGSFSVANLRIVHGDAYATVDGELFGPDGLEFDAFLNELGQYVDGAYGSLKATGTVSLRPSGQFLRLDASADELSVRGVTVRNLSIVDGGSDTAVLDASITAGSVIVGERDLGRVQILSRLGRIEQEFHIDLESATGTAGLSVAGVLDDWDSPSSWAGEIERLEFETDKAAATLDEPADLRVAANNVTIDPFCLTGIRGVQICSEASRDTDAGTRIRSDVTSVPLDAINVFVDTRLDFEQVVTGNFRWQSNPDGTSSGRGEAAMTAGKIASLDDPELFIETGPARLGFDLDDDNLRGGVLDIPFPGLGQIAAEFELLDVTDGESADLRGLLDVDIHDIGLLVALFPIVDDAGGSLRADLAFGGTANEPSVSGDFRLERGSLSYLPVGLQLDEIELRSELQENGAIELTGSFRAGEGLGEIRTRADHAQTAAAGLELTLSGKNLTLVDVPDVQAIADTDLTVNFDGRTLEMNGDITIPRARIRPSNLTTPRVFESEDVVIVAGELPDETESTAVASDLEYAGSVEVTLGDDVVVDLDVTEVEVAGSTVFSWAGEPIPNGIGRYDVDGEVLVFGQRLEITEGSVRFEDEPADDPYLRVRAEREIFGNTQVRRAGVLVAGRLSRLSIEPYTNPATTEERALTLLVTGSDFDYERGVGAIDFGTYITPRVFVSYGIGLFDSENVIRIRYDLKRGFGVTGTSGGRESGVDLSYQFEN